MLKRLLLLLTLVIFTFVQPPPPPPTIEDENSKLPPNSLLFLKLPHLLDPKKTLLFPLSLLLPKLSELPNDDKLYDRDRPTQGPSRTVVGEARLEGLVSDSNLGGSSKVLALLGLDWAAQGLGLPGASSHWNGTEAKELSGGVGISGGSFGLLGSENKESVGVEFGSY